MSQPPTCRRCGYSLVGLPGLPCPECNTPFDDRPNKPAARTCAKLALLLGLPAVGATLAILFLPAVIPAAILTALAYPLADYACEETATHRVEEPTLRLATWAQRLTLLAGVAIAIQMVAHAVRPGILGMW